MGRWQSEYYDEVLGSKLKSLVYGAIERAKLEKDDPQPPPTISYENFVQDLDHGDSFTTTLVEILVKELAERKTRPSSTDRHLIAERTAKSLRMLGHGRIFRDRSSASRRPFANDFFVQHSGGSTTLDWDAALTQHADEDEVDVDDDITANPGVHRYEVEPVYHPYADSASNTAIRRFPAQSTDPGTDDDMVTTLGYPTRRSPPAHFSLTRHASLSRQSSIRRPARSRTNDFSEFTTRRRTSGRHDQSTQSGSGPGSSSRASGSGAGDSSSSMDIANLLQSHQNNLNDDAESSMPVATLASASAGSSLVRRGVTRARPSDERDLMGGESTSNPRFTPFNLHTSGTSSSAAPSSSRLHVNAPRLRRGGVRAPEQYAPGGPAAGDGYTHTVRISSPPIPGLHTLSHRPDEQRLPLPRRSSSAEMEYIIQTASERFGSRSPGGTSPPPWGTSWHGWGGPPGANVNVNASANRQQSGTPTNLPTPRSISPENSSTRE